MKETAYWRMEARERTHQNFMMRAIMVGSLLARKRKV